jgi:hypothetical protein
MFLIYLSEGKPSCPLLAAALHLAVDSLRLAGPTNPQHFELGRLCPPLYCIPMCRHCWEAVLLLQQRRNHQQ